MDSKHLKYLAVSPQDLMWGTAVNSVGFQDITPGMPYPPQDHPSRYVFSTDRGRILNEYQLVYITRGKGRFASAALGHGVDVKEGSMMLLFPGEWHTYRPDKDSGWKEYWIGFQGSTIDHIVKEGFFSKARPIFNPGLRDEVVNLYESAVRVAEEGRSSFQQVLGAIAMHILSQAVYFDRNRTFQSSGVLEKMESAKAIIAAEYTHIEPGEIASRLFMSYSAFRKSFRQYTGFSPAKYILDVRFSRVKEELTNTAKPVKDIAYSMGFPNYDYFLTAFKRITGQTPSEYREMTGGK